MPSNKSTAILSWLMRGLAAVIMLQTLFFKFTGASESVYIFSTLGVEPWGRFGTGVMELIASVLILLPRTKVIGALMALAIMSGAVLSHVLFLGIAVENDGGLLFLYAVTVLTCSLVVLWLHRSELIKLLPATLSARFF